MVEVPVLHERAPELPAETALLSSWCVLLPPIVIHFTHKKHTHSLCAFVDHSDKRCDATSRPTFDSKCYENLQDVVLAAVALATSAAVLQAAIVVAATAVLAVLLQQRLHYQQ